MGRPRSSWRQRISRLFAWSIISTALVMGIRVLPQNVYRDAPLIYVLKPATFKPSIADEIQRRIDEAKKPKQVTNEILCLAQVIYFESGFEPTQGIEAVAAVVFNRTMSKYYPHTICGVVYQPYQFSWTLDYSKWARVPPKKYMELARSFFRNRTMLQTTYEKLTHFHHIDISPTWNAQTNMEYVVTYGQHKFYAWAPK